MSITSTGAAALLCVAAVSLGTPLRQDGYALRPPEGFRMVRMDPFRGTQVGAVPEEGQAPGHLTAALVDGEGPDAASIVVAVVEGTFSASPSTRDDFSARVIHHFNDQLGMPLSLERAELVREPAPRIEVQGTIKKQDQLRRVLVAGMEGEGRHAVLTFSVPSGRYEALLPTLRASLDSFRPDAPPPGRLSRSAVAGLASTIVLGMLGSWSLWRRRKELRSARGDSPHPM
jgi:hypothetical protein